MWINQYLLCCGFILKHSSTSSGSLDSVVVPALDRSFRGGAANGSHWVATNVTPGVVTVSVHAKYIMHSVSVFCYNTNPSYSVLLISKILLARILNS